MTTQALREIAQRIIVDGSAREDESLGEHILALCRAYLSRTEPVEIKHQTGFAIHKCACGEKQDATKSIRIKFCHYCGRPIKWT